MVLEAVVSVGLATASQAAVANTIYTTYAGAANFGSGPVGYFGGSVAPNPNSATNFVGVGIGGDSFTTTNFNYAFSSTGQFNTWCVDIYHWMAGGSVTYNVGTVFDLALELNTLRPGTPTGTQRASDLVRLANEVYSTVDTKTESAAFQLAVWAIAYGSTDGAGHYAIGTTDPGFRVDNGTASSAYGVMANTWLSVLDTAPNSGPGVWDLTYLNDGTGNFTQDMIVFTNSPGPGSSAPEPASLALLGLGLVGIGYGRRKKT